MRRGRFLVRLPRVTPGTTVLLRSGSVPESTALRPPAGAATGATAPQTTGEAVRRFGAATLPVSLVPNEVGRSPRSARRAFGARPRHLSADGLAVLLPPDPAR